MGLVGTSIPDIAGALATDAGYVVFANRASEAVGTMPTAFYSTDGREWGAVPLGEMVPGCSGDPRPDASVSAGATDGHTIVLVGARFTFDAESCATGYEGSAAAWVSVDGRSWQRSAPFGVAAVRNAGAESVWAVPGGWQTAVGHGAVANGLDIWQSPDGLKWREIGTLTGPGIRGARAASDGSGTIMLRPVSNMPDAWRLRMSTDGRSWEPIDAAGCGSVAGQVLPPLPNGIHEWVVTRDPAFESDQLICTSPDAAHWSSAPPPGGPPPAAVTLVAQTRYGILALGQPCWAAGCDGSEPLAWMSGDGRAWQPVSPLPAFVFGVVDGPAGVLALATSSESHGFDLAAWRLGPP